MKTNSKSDRVLTYWISRILFYNFLISVLLGLLFVNVDSFAEYYNFSYDYLNELFNTSLATSVFYLLVSYRNKLCLYNKISAWANISQFVFNILALNFFTLENYDTYTSFYVNFMLFPTALLAINYLIIEERKNRKQNKIIDEITEENKKSGL